MDVTTNAKQKVTCIANYAYSASEGDELSLQPGDVVTEVERLGGGWWRGELRGRTGMFPDNFVSIIDQDNVRSGGVQGKCRAVFSYQPANPDELPLAVGDVLDVLGEVEEGWWQGRRQGQVGVFPSNFVVMLDPPAAAATFEPAPALPPKPVKELCRVIFPYTAVNEDELTLAEGDIVTVLSREAPDRGWWRGELAGRQGLFPDNFVQLLPPQQHHVSPVSHDVEEKRPERPPPKAAAAAPLYPLLNKYSEKVTSVKELTTTKVSLHKDNSVSKESNTHSSLTHTNKSETEKHIHSESHVDNNLDGPPKKPPVPTKKSPTPGSGVVGGLFSGLKSKMLSSTDKEKSVSSSGSNSSGEWDKPDGGGASRPAAPPAPATSTNTFDRIERNSILNDPRAQRVKAPRRRPPSQAFREDITIQQIGLSNGHEVEKSANTAGTNNTNNISSTTNAASTNSTNSTGGPEEVVPRAREWEKHKAPWMEELKLNQAKKSSTDTTRVNRNAGSTDKLLEIGLEEKKTTHSMEMSKSTSSISNRISIIESYEETKSRNSLESKRESLGREPEVLATKPAPVQSPTAAGRTFTSMLDEVRRPPAPAASARVSHDFSNQKPDTNLHKTDTNLHKPDTNLHKPDTNLHKPDTNFHKTDTNLHKPDTNLHKPDTNLHRDTNDKTTVNEKYVHVTTETVSGGSKLQEKGGGRDDVTEALIAQLNNRITNLEKLVEVQAAQYSSAIAELSRKLALESERRLVLQSEMEKLAQCVTQV